MYTEEIYHEALVVMMFFFIIPFALMSARFRIYPNFSVANLVAVLNKTLVVYAIMCVLFVIFMAISNHFSESHTGYNKFLQKGGNVIIAGFYFFVIATPFFFFPALLLLRLANYLSKPTQISKD